MNLRDWPLTVIIVAVAVGISAFLWSIGIYFFFLPIIFLPFLKFVKLKPQESKSHVCSTCGLPSEGNYCPRCGTRLN
jgi:hypothetical protein